MGELSVEWRANRDAALLRTMARMIPALAATIRIDRQEDHPAAGHIRVDHSSQHTFSGTMGRLEQDTGSTPVFFVHPQAPRCSRLSKTSNAF
jgi:hypothetical protein